VKEGENLKQDFYAAEEKLDDANEIRKEKKRKEKKKSILITTCCCTLPLFHNGISKKI
jgi:hypothetical protein